MERAPSFLFIYAADQPGPALQMRSQDAPSERAETAQGRPKKREDGKSMSEVMNVTEIFGENAFNDVVMRERLPKSV